MKDVWERVKAWLRANAPEILQDLRPGASATEIRAAEDRIGVRFPDDVRESYRIHDGSTSCALLNYWDFYSLAEMVTSWESLKALFDQGTFDEVGGEPAGPVRPAWWLPGWVPITYESGGNHHCIDLDPAEGGTPGQVIEWWHDAPEVVVIAPSFRAWLDALADDLETGEIVLDDEGVLVPRDRG